MSLLDRARDLRKGVDWAALRAKKAKLLKNIPDIKVPEGMVRIPAGKFHMGASFEKRFQDALPVHEVELDEYWIDKTEVTNAAFARFVKATGYVTIAEREPDPKEFPGVKPEDLAPFSLVFTPPKDPDTPVRGERDWWSVVYGGMLVCPRRPQKHDCRSLGSSCRAGLLSRCSRLCEMGKKATPDGGRMGASGSRWPGPKEVHVGRQITSRR